MNNKYLLFGILALIGVVTLSGCTDQATTPGCPTCPNPGKWSECTDQAIKTRTNYQCGAETNYTCESYTEEGTCETEIQLKGTKDLEGLITPSLDETVKGIIKVEVFNVPEDTEFVMFLFYPQEVQLGSDMSDEDVAKVIRERDFTGADGWSVFFDTTSAENGLYKMFIGPTYEDAPDENPWTTYGQAQVIVNN